MAASFNQSAQFPATVAQLRAFLYNQTFCTALNFEFQNENAYSNGLVLSYKHGVTFYVKYGDMPFAIDGTVYDVPANGYVKFVPGVEEPIIWEAAR